MSKPLETEYLELAGEHTRALTKLLNIMKKSNLSTTDEIKYVENGIVKTRERVKKAKRESKDIYSMNLHEQIAIKGICIVRVPGGWLYDGVFVAMGRDEIVSQHGATVVIGGYSGKQRYGKAK